MEKELIRKYVRGELDGKELAEVEAALQQDASAKEYFAEVLAEDAFSSMPDRFYSGTDFQEKILPGTGAGRSRLGILAGRMLRVAVVVAAVLFVPLAVYEITRIHDGYYDESRTVFLSGTPMESDREPEITQCVKAGVRGMVELPDGSQVWLNSDSEISFPARFDSSARLVSLKGEAYFKAKKDQARPMFIECRNNILVKVTGTEFNITSYDNDDSFNLLLVSGHLSVEDRSSGRTYSVRPSQQLTLFDDSEMEPVKSSPVVKDKTAWKEGRLVFDDTAMPEVINRLERWFGIDIVVKDDRLLDYSFTATFTTESVTRVFDILKLSSSMDYEIKDNVVKVWI